MPSESRIESLASRVVDSNHAGHDEPDSDDEDLFAELEAEIANDDDARIRELGLAALRREVEQVKSMRENEYGTYTEIMDEKEVIRVTAKEPRCVVHFYHVNFKRCEIMDTHLAKLAPKYFNTRFCRVFVENIPWLVERLSIKVLPCVVCFVNGVTKDKLVGFEELGNNDSFTSGTLELRLSQSGVLQKRSTNVFEPIYQVSSRGTQNEDEVFDM